MLKFTYEPLWDQNLKKLNHKRSDSHTFNIIKQLSPINKNTQDEQAKKLLSTTLKLLDQSKVITGLLASIDQDRQKKISPFQATSCYHILVKKLSDDGYFNLNISPIFLLRLEQFDFNKGLLNPNDAPLLSIPADDYTQEHDEGVQYHCFGVDAKEVLSSRTKKPLQYNMSLAFYSHLDDVHAVLNCDNQTTAQTINLEHFIKNNISEVA